MKINTVYVGVFNKTEVLSGPEKVCKRIFEEYSKIDRTLFIEYFQDGKQYGYFKKLLGYEKVAEINGSEVLKLGIFRILFELIKLSPKNVHVLCFSRFVIVLYMMKIFLRVKILYTVNGIIRHENKYYNNEPKFVTLKNIIVENIIIYCSDRIFYLSEISRTVLSHYFSVDKAGLTLAINGLDSCFWSYKASNFLEKEANSVVFIGDVDRKEKGFDFLIDSIALINISLKLYIIGNINKYKVPNNKYYGTFFVNKMLPCEMIEFIRNKCVVVSPSEYDPFNISALEAISCGLYPILTKQTGLSEFIGNFVNASLVDYGDKNSLAQIFNEVFSNKLHFQLLNDLKLFSWENVLKNYYLPHYE